MLAVLGAVCCAQLALMAFLLIDRRAERRETAAERATLMQRIQAPREAVQQHMIQSAPVATPIPLGIEDDEMWHETRDEMAERLARIEA